MRNSNIGSIIILIISPIIGLIGALWNGHLHSQRYLRNVIWIFVVLYGSTFSKDGIGDGTRHWQNVYDYYYDLTLSEFISDSWDILTFKTNINVQEDMYIHVLSYFSGAFLKLPGLFFVFVASVYGYFFAGSIVRVFKIFPSLRNHFSVFILAALFIALLNIQSMNTVRTWTGFWILFYSVISFYQSGERKYLWLLLFPPLIHIGYFIMILPVLIVLIFPYINKSLIVGIYVLSFVTNFLSPPKLLSELNRTEVGQEKVDAYSVDEKASIEDKITPYQSKRWYKQYEKSGLVSWSIVLLTSLIIFSGVFWKYFSVFETRLFSIGLLMKILSNSTWFLFALNNRSDVISMHFILAAVLLYWQRNFLSNNEVSFRLVFRIPYYISILFVLPYFAYTLSNTIQYASVFLLWFPAIAWIDESLNITMREAIVFLFF